MSNDTSKPNVLDYEDYRKYLRDWYSWMKQTNSAFSYRAFSNWAGLHSPNHLQLIIQGKRNITQKTITIFVKILKLKQKEQKYFELLVNFNQSKNQETKSKYLLEISEYHKKHGNLLKKNQYSYLTKWFMPVIRELIAIKGFKEDYDWISRRLNNTITQKEAKNAIDQLINLNLIKKENNKLQQESSILTTGEDAQNSSAFLYHQQMLDLAINALKTQTPEERNFAGITLSCNKKDVQEIQQMIYDFRSKILNYLDNRIDKDSDDEVYQLGIQFFRITKKES